MSTHNVVTDQDLGVMLEVIAGKLNVKLASSIRLTADGELDVDVSNIDVVSADQDNLITIGPDGGALFNQAALQGAETAFTGTSTGFLTVTPGGTNGHAPTYAIDFTHPDFIEAAQDAIGSALLASAGIQYDDVANTISSALGNLTFGNGLTSAGLTSIAVLADPNSPSPVTVTAAGVSVTPGISGDVNNLAKLGTDSRVMVDSADVVALASDTICNLAGDPIAKVIPV